ncbi:penicillin-binding protein [bacterium]|nr:penicillin-binding protein [bacterium]
MRRLFAIAVATALVTSGCVWAGGADDTTTSTGASTTTTSAPGQTGVPTTAGLPLADSERREALSAARTYLSAWADGDHRAAAATVATGQGEAEAVLDAWQESLALHDLALTIVGDELFVGRGTVSFEAEATVGGIGPWQWSGSLSMIDTEDGWRIDWAPSAVHPDLDDGDLVEIIREWPIRAPILAADGRPLSATGQQRAIGVVPGWIEDLDTVLSELEDLAGISPDHVTSEMARPGVQADWFVQVGEVDESVYSAYQERFDALVGVEMRPVEGRISITRPFADHVLGTMGPITPEILEALGPPYSGFDVVGRSGLELAHERSLAGTPAQEIRIVNKYGRVTSSLYSVESSESEPLRTTLDVNTQIAAEAALDGSRLPASLVVVDIETGAVRAVVSRPLDGFDRAVNGLYPPGSTFKLVTVLAALETDALEDDSLVECPGSIVVGGLRIQNAGERDLGTIPLGTSVAASCNTTFAWLGAEAIASADLVATAERLGYGSNLVAGVPAVAGTFPEPLDTAERGAAAIGQGRVLITPFHAASIPAAIMSGTWHAPTLLAEPGSGPSDAPLDPAAAAAIQDFMLQVVTTGTGQNAAVEGEIVRGKTGSAEYGGDTTHAWFVGAWDDLALAVVVEGGGGGGSAAAPIAADFIERMIALRGG